MATVHNALYARLAASTSVTNLAGTRIFPNEAPQTTPMPYIVYRRVVDEPVRAMSSDPGLIRSEFEVECVGDNAAGTDGAYTLANVVRTALNRWSSTTTSPNIEEAFVESMDEDWIDTDDSDIGRYVATVDVTIWHR